MNQERIKELREWLNSAEGDGYDYVSDNRAVADLLAILDEHSNWPYGDPEANNEHSKPRITSIAGELIDREYAEDEAKEPTCERCADLLREVERLATEASHHQHDAFYAEQRAEKAEAELAATQKRFDEFAYGVQCLVSSLAGTPGSTRGPE